MTSSREAGNTATSPESGAPPFGFPGFDLGVLIANPQRAAEAWIAASQTLLQGMQEVSRRQLMLQSALMEQATRGAFSILQLAQPGAKAEEATASAQAATAVTLQSMQEIMTAACKCSMDALTVYRDRMAGSGPAAAGECGHADRPQAAAE